MPNVLEKIAAYKLEEIAKLKTRISPLELRQQAKSQAKPRGFVEAIKKARSNGPAIIAEVKKASPSKGIIREDFDPVSIAKAYTKGGATCLSVLTDQPSFMGSNEIFAKVRTTTNLPIIRKDFMLDPVQIIESRALGADAILIILAMVDDELARALMDEAQELGMDALVETHDQYEIARALKLNADFIGINNRDLRTFHTSLETFKKISQSVPSNKTLVAESGIFTPNHILELTEFGASAFLVGESLMRRDNVERSLRILRGEEQDLT